MKYLAKESEMPIHNRFSILQELRMKIRLSQFYIYTLLTVVNLCSTGELFQVFRSGIWYVVASTKAPIIIFNGLLLSALFHGSVRLTDFSLGLCSSVVVM